MDKATLLLSDGSVYIGRAFGARVAASGDVAFTTGAVGCVERLTDPVTAGKLIVHTFPEIGGYGVIPGDFISPGVHAAGVICRAWCPHPSNDRSQDDLDGFLCKQGVPGLCGIDTRALMIKLRGAGPLRGAIVQGEVAASDPAAMRLLEEKIPFPMAPEAASVGPVPGGNGPRVAVLNYGRGTPLAQALAERGAAVSVMQPDARCDLARFDAIALSDGPETDPMPAPPALPAGKPVLAEGVGHILLALARGGKAGRMRAQHGGSNQPVSWGERVYITDQFHAYCVQEPPAGALEIYRNLNDQTVEAIVYADALGVQFPISTQQGPHDMGFVYDRFFMMAKEAAHAAG